MAAPTRRRLLQSLALSSGAALLPSCDSAVTQITQQLGQRVPQRIEPASGTEIDADFHLLARASFGAWPGELAELKTMGHAAWIERQLEPEGIDDLLCEARVNWFESIQTSIADAYDYRKEVLRNELTRHALLRALYSKRQLFEVMVEFWSDHLNIDLEKGDCVYLKPSDDREVIRRHALGNFHDLIRASATSPAMLVYLDGTSNKVRRKTKDVPNENYARELMELHTMGVHGGYTQADVSDAARCLSGWTFEPKRLLALDVDAALFRPENHDAGEKVVLGQRIAATSGQGAASRVSNLDRINKALHIGGTPAQRKVVAAPTGDEPRDGSGDLDALVNIVCSHPSTAQFIATKLCRHFVSYEPPAALVARVAAEFTRTGGEIKPLLRMILSSEEFSSTRGNLLKRPFRYVVSTLRMLGADTHAAANGPLVQALGRMGHGLFQFPTPDGYPDEEAPWMGTLMWRWNFALGLVDGTLTNITVPLQALGKALQATPADSAAWPRWFEYLHGRAPTEAERTALAPLVAVAVETTTAPAKGKRPPRPTLDAQHKELLGLLLAGPAYQRC